MSHSDPPRYKRICPSPLSVFPCPLESPVEASFLLHTTDSSLWGLDLSLGKYIRSTKVSSRSENRDCPPVCPQQPSEPTCSRSLGVACSTASGTPVKADQSVVPALTRARNQLLFPQDAECYGHFLIILYNEVTFYLTNRDVTVNLPKATLC